MRNDQPDGKDRNEAPPRVTSGTGRTVAGQLVVAALARIDQAEAAGRRAERLDYLAGLQERLAASLDETAVRKTLAGVCLPGADSWAIVDLHDSDGTLLRLAIPTADETRQSAVDALNASWRPQEGDPFGYPAASRATGAVALVERIDEHLALAAHDPEHLARLQALGFGSCLTVPIRVEERLEGAITFVTRSARTGFAEEEVTFAGQVAASCARALHNVRRYRAADLRRENAESSDRAMVDALGLVTHELRTPLSAIGGYAELMQLGVRGPVTPEQRGDLERIRWNQQYLLAMITQILAYVRVDTGRSQFTIAPVDLGPVAASTAEMIAPLVKAKGQVAACESCEAGAVVALADADKVRQVVLNLLTNAMKYSPEGARLVLRAGADGTQRFIEVEDEGSGIPVHERERIFEPFAQLPDGMASRGGGVGLGLSIARQLARGMGGDLTVCSGRSRGSVFRLTLPAEPAQPSQRLQPPRSQGQPGQGPGAE